ncbi:hypothetical protein BJY04DRAFT_222633 [Aspergillus karnatakaensis]|uniref:uncharacterized protein n=1 Tax=Aspergillus karnatakaensis TaxID=1810916 RepID=UPI003CCE42C8
MSYEVPPDYTPRWGRLPVEQYLMRYWDHSSSEPIDQQRVRLVREYIHLDRIPKEWDPTEFGQAWYKPDANDTDPQWAPKRIPTDHEIETILRPWRSQELRKRAWQIWCDRSRGHPVVLRTYYNHGEKGDKMFTDYIQVSDQIDAVADVYALNDAEVFDFGSDWWRVFDVLPEAAGCQQDRPYYDYSDAKNPGVIKYPDFLPRSPDQEMLDEDLADVEEEIEKMKAEYPHWREDPDVLLEPGDTVVRSILRTVSISWIILVDEETFRTDQIVIKYLDMHQNVTVEDRMDLDQGYIDEMLMRWENGGRPLGIVMENGTIGDRYRLSSESGRRFFRLNDDLEYQADDPNSSEAEQ